MNKKEYILKVFFESKKIFDEKVKKIKLTSPKGRMSIFPGHSELLAIVHPEIISIFLKNNKEKRLYISDGIIEISPKIVFILAGSCISHKKEL